MPEGLLIFCGHHGERVQFPQFRVAAEHPHSKAVRKEFPGNGAVPIAHSRKERFPKLQKGRRRQREVPGQTDIEDMAQLVEKHTLRRGMLVSQDARQENITGDRVVVEKIGDAKGVISAVPTVRKKHQHWLRGQHLSRKVAILIQKTQKPFGGVRCDLRAISGNKLALEMLQDQADLLQILLSPPAKPPWPVEK